MNDFYSAAAQIIPVLLLTLVLEFPRRLRDLFPDTPARVRRGLALFSALLWLSVLAEVLALGGLSFDEERFPGKRYVDWQLPDQPGTDLAREFWSVEVRCRPPLFAPVGVSYWCQTSASRLTGARTIGGMARGSETAIREAKVSKFPVAKPGNDIYGSGGVFHE